MVNSYITKIKNPYKLLSWLIIKIKWLRIHLSDDTYLKIKYRGATGKKLDLNNPKSFNEKLQWLKLHDRKPEYTIMADKYEAKNFVAQKIGNQYIIPTLGVWNNFDEIDFNSLPNKFVLKCTHDSGGLVIVDDKSKLDMISAKNKINKCLNNNFYFYGREWPYKNIKPRIIAEQYISDKSSTTDKGLTDYKFYCFNGKPLFLYVSQGLHEHSTAHISFLTINWEFAPFYRKDYKQFNTLPEKPSKFDEMKVIAEKLSYGHKFLRVDLYQVNEQIYFSELTFYPSSGFTLIDPPEWELKLGEQLKIND